MKCLASDITLEESQNHDQIKFVQKLPLCVTAGIHGSGNAACLFQQR
jgi:hypothetical protein